jgi:hypothetical protein
MIKNNESKVEITTKRRINEQKGNLSENEFNKN